jgi:hypothetical protein
MVKRLLSKLQATDSRPFQPPSYLRRPRIRCHRLALVFSFSPHLSLLSPTHADSATYFLSCHCPGNPAFRAAPAVFAGRLIGYLLAHFTRPENFVL